MCCHRPRTHTAEVGVVVRAAGVQPDVGPVVDGQPKDVIARRVAKVVAGALGVALDRRRRAVQLAVDDRLAAVLDP